VFNIDQTPGQPIRYRREDHWERGRAVTWIQEAIRLGAA
jgi:hypothetical protein